METNHITKRHNKNFLLYHLVCPAKYRRKVFTNQVEQTLKIICQEISERYELRYVEIGTDEDHVHFLIQSVPMMLPSRIAQITKSITAKEIFKKHPDIKQNILWGGKFWTSGYYINTVGLHGNQETIKQYVQNQGKNYKKVYRTEPSPQMTLF